MPGYDPFKGHASQIAVGVESSQGDTNTPEQHLALIEEETEHPDPEINWYEERVIGGDRELHGKTKGQVAYEGGSYPVILVDAVPLVWVLGHEEYDDENNRHTITAAGLDDNNGESPPSMTVEATYFGRGGGNDFVRTFTGVCADSGTLSTDNDDRLTFEVDTVALGVDTGTSYTDVGSITEANPWLWSDISSDLSINGTTFARLQDWSLTIENNLSSRYYITSEVKSGDPYEILFGNVGYSFSATITVDDDTLYQEVIKANADTDISLEFTRDNGDSMDISVKKVGLTDADHSTPRGEGGDDEVVEVESNGTPEHVQIDIEDTVRSSAVL